MFDFNKKSESVSRVVYLYSEPVEILRYDKSSGEVSYTKDGTSLVYTCYDYELRCNQGIDGLRTILNRAPNEDIINKRLT